MTEGCHAELVSASASNIDYGFRIKARTNVLEFGMTEFLSK